MKDHLHVGELIVTDEHVLSETEKHKNVSGRNLDGELAEKAWHRSQVESISDAIIDHRGDGNLRPLDSLHHHLRNY